MLLKDYYKILGISASSDSRSIRKAWLKKALQFHPDHNPGDTLAEEQFKEAQEAYRILSDYSLRAQFDSGIFNWSAHEPATSSEVNHYFYVLSDSKNVMLFEELSITFVYSGEGRVFRRPSFNGFHITGSPFVDSRMVFHEGHRLKETSLTYILCPLKEGTLIIDPASIRIQGRILYTEPVKIKTTQSKCYFLQNEIADGKPLKYTMHYEFKKGEAPLRISENKKNHIILIPRSRSAYIFHSIGSAMKGIFTIWGAVMLHYYFDLNIFLGALAGSLLGGINVHLMYKLVNMKSKYQFAPQYPLVVEYGERGYYYGESAGIPLLKVNVIYQLGRMLV